MHFEMILKRGSSFFLLLEIGNGAGLQIVNKN